MLLANPCEGTDGVTVTAANSDDNGGNAFTTVITGASATNEYDTAQSVQGTSSIRQAGGSASQFHDTWGYTAVTRIFGRAYVRFGTGFQARSIIQIRASSTQRARITVTASGAIELRNAANTVVDTSTALSLDTWYRLEYDIAVGTTAVGTVNIYTLHGTSTLDVITGTSDFNAVNFDETRHGQIANASSLNDLWFDDLATTDVGLPGPSLVTVTPAVVAAAASVPAPSVATGSTITPAAAAAVAAVPAPTLSTGSVVSATAAAAVASTPAPAVATGSAVTPAAVAVAAAVPAATVEAGSGGATVTPGVIAAAGAVPSPTLATGSAVSAVTVAAVATVPSPTPSAGSSVSPASVAAVATVGAPTVTTGAGPTPATVAAVTAVPSPTLATGSVVSASTVTAAASTPAAAVSTGATVAPSVVSAVADVPTQVVSAGGNATVTPSVIAAIAAIGGPSLPATVSPAVVGGTAAVPGLALSAGSTVLPGLVATSAAVPDPRAYTFEPRRPYPGRPGRPVKARDSLRPTPSFRRPRR